ncbi:MAG TPA: hypothetical protein VFJ28_12870 [Marmoricola sp.]|nr:hypothetical protein [Marmoricola sp.]
MAELPGQRREEAKAVYEIRLRGAHAESLRRQFPTAAVVSTRTETVLFRRVEDPAELDELLDHLLSLGAVLTEVHEVPLPDAPSTTAPPAGPTSGEMSTP